MDAQNKALESPDMFYCESYQCRMPIRQCAMNQKQATQDSFENKAEFGAHVHPVARQKCLFCERNKNRRKNREKREPVEIIVKENPSAAEMVNCIKAKLQISNVEMAKKIGASHSAVFFWANGSREPKADHYVSVVRLYNEVVGDKKSHAIYTKKSAIEACKKLKRCRDKHKLMLKQIAGPLGVNIPTASNWVNGITSPHPSRVPAILKFIEQHEKEE